MSTPKGTGNDTTDSRSKREQNNLRQARIRINKLKGMNKVRRKRVRDYFHAVYSNPSFTADEQCLARLIRNVKGVSFNHTPINNTDLINQFFDAVVRRTPKTQPQIAKSKKHPKSKPLPKTKGFVTFNDFYLDQPWRQLRYKALVKHGAACQCCGATAASSGKPLHVDHIKPRSKFPELELVLDNLQILCEDCNMGKGGRDQTDWRTTHP